MNDFNKQNASENRRFKWQQDQIVLNDNHSHWLTLCFKFQQSTNEGLAIQNNDLSDIKHKNDLSGITPTKSGFGIQSNDLSSMKSSEGLEQKQPTEALKFDWSKRNGNGHSVSRQAAQQ